MTTFDSSLYANGRRLDCRVRRAQSMFSRIRGLLGYPALQQDQALLIAPCNSIHCIGMRYAIDVVYLAAQGDIVKLVPAVQPWGFSACASARQVVEFAAGAIERLDLRVGQRLDIRVEDAQSATSMDKRLEGQAS
jgi:uncharacterized membrane protein (UPF0127 family)